MLVLCISMEKTSTTWAKSRKIIGVAVPTKFSEVPNRTGLLFCDAACTGMLFILFRIRSRSNLGVLAEAGAMWKPSSGFMQKPWLRPTSAMLVLLHNKLFVPDPCLCWQAWGRAHRRLREGSQRRGDPQPSQVPRSWQRLAGTPSHRWQRLHLSWTGHQVQYPLLQFRGLWGGGRCFIICYGE